MRRIFLIVLDSVGAGEAPDACEFGDVGAHTLRSLYNSGRLKIENLLSLGLGNIEGLEFFGRAEAPKAVSARLVERSRGKDTTIGHWELCGHVSSAPLPTFPDGFGEDILSKITRISGRAILCNKPYSGTRVIEDFGAESVAQDKLIVYTSADSVLQIAAHERTVPIKELYRICSELRGELLGADDGVGRIIARPFLGDAESGFYRTENRRDFSIEPPVLLLPEAVKRSGLSSISIGKIYDIFAGREFDESRRTHSNAEGMSVVMEYAKKDFCGLCFANLVDFDMLWGHRRDQAAYADGLSEFDRALGELLPYIGRDDALIITADHGCDPCFLKTTDHTREYVPLLIYSPGIQPEELGTRESFADLGATVARLLGIDFECDGRAINLKLKG